MASTKVTLAEEIRRNRAFCEAHGIKFTLVPGKAKPRPKPEGTFDQPTPTLLHWLGIPISEESLRKYFAAREEFIHQRPLSALRKKVEMYIQIGRAMLSAGNARGATEAVEQIDRVLQEPDTDLGRRKREKSSDGGKATQRKCKAELAARNANIRRDYEHMTLPERERASVLTLKYKVSASQIRRILTPK